MRGGARGDAGVLRSSPSSSSSIVVVALLFARNVFFDCASLKAATFLDLFLTFLDLETGDRPVSSVGPALSSSPARVKWLCEE